MDPHVQTFLEKIEKKLTSKDAGKRVKCIGELTKYMDTSDECVVEGMDILISLLKDEEPWVRKESLRAIEGLVGTVMDRCEKGESYQVKHGGKMVPIKKLLFYQSIQLTKDPDPEIRLQAVKIAGDKSLEYSLIREKATPFLMARIKDEDKAVRNAAIGYITKISIRHPEQTVPLLMRLYKGRKRSTDVYVTYILDKIMMKHSLPEFVPLMFEKIDEAEVSTEKYIISALAKCGLHAMDDIHDQVVHGLTDRTDMTWWVGTRNTLLILTPIAEKQPEMLRPYLRYFLPLLSGENRELRRLTVEMLAKMGAGNPDNVKEALATMVELIRDPDEKVKESAHRALHIIGITDGEFQIVHDASRSLNEAKLTVVHLKKENDLTERIRLLFTNARNSFSNHEFERSLEYSSQAIISSKARVRLRTIAHEAINAADRVVTNSTNDGLDIGSIAGIIDTAKRAFSDQKYFLAHELIFKSSNDAAHTSRSNPLANPYAMDPDMESRVDGLVCHHCGERVPKGNTNCHGCGHQLGSTHCRQCEAVIPQGYQFCTKCGQQLDHVCQVCGAINEVGEKECEICGSALMAPLRKLSVASITSQPDPQEQKGVELELELVPTNRT